MEKLRINKLIGWSKNLGLDLESLLSELRNANDFKLREVNHLAIPIFKIIYLSCKITSNIVYKRRNDEDFEIQAV